MIVDIIGKVDADICKSKCIPLQPSLLNRLGLAFSDPDQYTSITCLEPSTSKYEQADTTVASSVANGAPVRTFGGIYAKSRIIYCLSWEKSIVGKKSSIEKIVSAQKRSRDVNLMFER